jgi:hypothetical protein
MRFWAAHHAGYRPTSVNEIKDRSSSKTSGGVGAADAGLVEIVAGGVLDATRGFEKVDDSRVEATIRATDAKASEDTVIARDLLRQYQERSVEKLAETALINKVGIRDPGITASIAEKLRPGRIDGPIHQFELLLRGYTDWIEQICANLIYHFGAELLVELFGIPGSMVRRSKLFSQLTQA